MPLHHVAQPPPRPTAAIAAPPHPMSKVSTCYSSVLCRLRTSPRTLLRREERGSEEGKADAVRGAFGGEEASFAADEGPD
jgi:hypothetical protein